MERPRRARRRWWWSTVQCCTLEGSIPCVGRARWACSSPLEGRYSKCKTTGDCRLVIVDSGARLHSVSRHGHRAIPPASPQNQLPSNDLVSNQLPRSAAISYTVLYPALCPLRLFHVSTCTDVMYSLIL